MPESICGQASGHVKQGCRFKKKLTAIFELLYADTESLSKEGKNFNCATCTKAVMKARRCREDRWDFTEADGPAFPIYINRYGSSPGELYGFCPAKVLRDEPEAVQIFRMLMISAETGVMLKAGGMEDQPYWYLDLLGWIIPKLDLVKFAMKAKMVLGSSGGSGADRTKQLFKDAQRTARGSNNRSATR